MDILVLGAVVVVLTVVVYLLATLGTKETPFEEAVAVQRQKREQENAQTKSEKQHKKQKVKKVKPKKDDSENVGVAVVQEVEDEPEPTPEPEPEPTPQPIEKKKEKRKKKDKERDVEEAPQKIVVEEVEETVTVKTEAVKVKAAPEPKPSPPAPVMEAAVKAVEAPVVAPPVEVNSPPVAAVEKHTPTQDKKKKKEKQKNDISAMSQSKLLPMVQHAPLSGAEIQTLIDILLNKQQQNNAAGDWVKKGRVDPITQLKRQLEELENRLRDKDETQSALSAKITDLCSELHGERSRVTKLKTQLEDTIANHTRQMDAAASNAQSTQTARLNELRSSLEQEYQTKLQQQQQLVEQLQNASNENEVTTLRASLDEAEMQAKMLQQEHAELTQRCQQYEEHIRAHEEKRAGEDAARSAQLTELQAQIHNADAARAQALAELAAMERDQEALAGQLANENRKFTQLQHKLRETLHEKAEVDSRLNKVESELCSVRQVVSDQNTSIERLKEEKESLASQSVRPAAEGQENGDVHAEQTSAPNTAHLETLVKEKESVIEEQLNEITNQQKEIARLKEDLESQRAKNNDQGAFLSEFETKALQVATQTSQQPEPEVVEKVVEVVKVVEKAVEVMVEDPALKSQVEELIEENAELRNQVADLQRVSVSTDGTQRVSELEEEVRVVTEKVTHYQKVLADTENLLKSLQASVESEEVAWNVRLSEKEKDVRQLTADKANLQLQVKQLEDTLEKVKEAEDMQAQLKVLQEQLQKEEKEKASVLEQLQQAQEQLTQTATQGGSASDEASLLELKADNDKLRTLVSVGQDASRQQEQLIEQLQEELAAVKTASTNGPASEEQCKEDDTLRADTASLMSTSSASVTDTNPAQVNSGAPAKKTKKKKKGAGATH
ncbi:uncharacterized protein [Panulirus ornatus]|uniref:uncharacterized protein isoform X34 n=1 Tax=Panulirus ornatus TaxID=150431 RepID=UPI003A8605A8